MHELGSFGGGTAQKEPRKDGDQSDDEDSTLLGVPGLEDREQSTGKPVFSKSIILEA